MLRSRAAKTLLVVAILAAALGVRIAYVENTSYHAIFDAGTYNRFGATIAQTGDYQTGTGPGSGAGGSRGPTAYFPPGFPYFLAAVDLIDGHKAGGKPAVPPERIAQAGLETVAVGLLGLVAYEAFGGLVAVVCMALAALYPVLIELSGVLVAENLLIVFELAAVWTTLRARRARNPYPWIVATGVMTGLATLTHQNAFVLVLPLGFALAIGSRARAVAQPRPNRTRARLRALVAPTIFLIITCATIAPWTIRNANELHHFIPVSDETGITLRGTYNPTSAAFSPVPYKWRFFWTIPADDDVQRTAAHYTEVALGNKLESRALHYIGAHPLAPLDVAFHNTLRMFELEGTYAWEASAYAMGIHSATAQVGVIAFWIVCLLALAGCFTSAVRRSPKWLWAIPVLLALTVVFINVETPRFREPVEPFLLLLAGCAVASGLRRAGSALGLRGAPVGRGRRPSRLAGHRELVEMGQRLA